jgi:hypothetical protein
MTRAERIRLAFLTSTHVVDDLYQGAVPALLPFLAIGVTLGLAVSAGGLAAPLFGVLADSYGLLTAFGAIAAFPAAGCALTFLRSAATLRPGRAPWPARVRGHRPGPRLPRPDRRGEHVHRASAADLRPTHRPAGDAGGGGGDLPQAGGPA